MIRGCVVYILTMWYQWNLYLCYLKWKTHLHKYTQINGSMKVIMMLYRVNHYSVQCSVDARFVWDKWRLFIFIFILRNFFWVFFHTLMKITKKKFKKNLEQIFSLRSRKIKMWKYENKNKKSHLSHTALASTLHCPL